jgi:3-deoxy-manno-octulosonate cytidylyltransferase (CMP-KDO synthetase)
MERRIIGIVPARFCSKRLPGKALAAIGGHPMIWHVYSRAKASKLLDKVIVATDDGRISDEVKKFKGEVTMTSRKHLSGTDRVAEAASKENLKPTDIVVNIQGDEPMVEGKMLDELAIPFKSEDIVMTTLAHRAALDEARDKNVVKVVFDRNHNALYFSRSPIPAYRDANTKAIYWKHLGFYAYTYSFLKIFTELPPGRLEKLEKLEQLRALEYGYDIRVVETWYDTISVDTRGDLRKVRRIFKRSQLCR